MGTYTLRIVTDNDAFQENMREEIARILRRAVSNLETDISMDNTLRDLNGNVVGETYYTEEEL